MPSSGGLMARADKEKDPNPIVMNRIKKSFFMFILIKMNKLSLLQNYKNEWYKNNIV